MIIYNNVLLVKMAGPVWYTIYHHLPAVKGVNKPLYYIINQPMEKVRYLRTINHSEIGVIVTN